jgi:hypothetical protein
VVNATPRLVYPWERYTVSIFRMLGGPWIYSGRVRKIPPPLALNLHTFQPGASLYSDHAVPAAENVNAVFRDAYLNNQVIMNHENVRGLQFFNSCLEIVIFHHADISAFLICLTLKNFVTLFCE